MGWRARIKKYFTGTDLNDLHNVFGYSNAQTLVQVLMQCRDDLSNKNIMKQALDMDMDFR